MISETASDLAYRGELSFAPRLIVVACVPPINRWSRNLPNSADTSGAPVLNKFCSARIISTIKILFKYPIWATENY